MAGPAADKSAAGGTACPAAPLRKAAAMQDIYESAAKREQRRRDSRLHTGIDSLFDFEELRPSSEVIANGHKQSPLFDKVR